MPNNPPSKPPPKSAGAPAADRARQPSEDAPAPAPPPPAGSFAALLEAPGRALAARPVLVLALFTALCAVVWGFLLLGYFPRKIDFEEQMYGNLPKDLLEGMVLPLRGYATQRWEGGAYPWGLFIAPFFAIFGKSLYALKLAGVVFAALGAWPWLDLARRVGGPRAALPMALLLLLPFPFYLRMTLTAFSPPTHMGAVFFTGYALWLLYRGLGDRTLRPGRAAFGAGLVLGAGAFWAFSIWPLVLGAGVTALVLGARLRSLLLLLAGTLPGVAAAFFILLVPIMAQHPGGVWGALVTWSWPDMISNQPRSPVSVAGMAQHLLELITQYFPLMGGFVPEGMPPGHMVPTFSWIPFAGVMVALGGLAAAWVRALAARRPPGLRPWLAVALPAVVYLLFYLASGLYTVVNSGYDRFRYFEPLVPFGFLTVAVALGRLGAARAGRVGHAILLFLILFFGVLSAGNVFDARVVPTPYRLFKGYEVTFRYAEQERPYYRDGLAMAGRSDYHDLAFGYGVWEGVDSEGRVILRRPPRELPRLLHRPYWEGVGAGFRAILDDALGTTLPMAALASSFATLFTPKGLGGGADAARVPPLPAGGLEVMRAMLRRRPDGVRRALIRGFTRGMSHFGPLSRLRTADILSAVLEGMPDRERVMPEVMGAFFTATGELAAKVWMFIDRPAGAVELLPEDAEPNFVRGLGIGLARAMLPGRPWVAPVKPPLPIHPDLLPILYRHVAAEQGRLAAQNTAFADVPPMP